jgi:hypothetical protein
VSQRTAAARPLQGCGSPHRSNHINLSVAVQRAKQAESRRVKYWEIIADNLHDVGWSLGWVSALDVEGRTIWIADTHRGDGKRFVVRADEKASCVFGTRVNCSHPISRM